MKIKPQIYSILSCLLFLNLTQCAVSESILTNNCDGSDPFELGRRHGSKGLPTMTEETQFEAVYECVPEGPSEKADKYMIGYNSGLADYCTKENGFNVAVANQIYKSICPTLAEREFLKGLEAGQKYRQAQDQNQQIEQKISILEESLKSMNPASKESQEVSFQLKNLKKELSANQNKIQKETKNL